MRGGCTRTITFVPAVAAFAVFAIGLYFSFSGIRRRSRQLLSMGLLMLGMFAVVVGIILWFAINLESEPPDLAITVAGTVLGLGAAGIILGVMILVWKNFIWADRYRSRANRQEKF